MDEKQLLEAIRAVVREEIEPIKEQQEAHTKAIVALAEQQKIHTESILTLENSVTHELKLLSENLPNAIVRHEKLIEITETVDNHSHRIFALEEAANK